MAHLVEEFDKIIGGPLHQFLKLSYDFRGPVCDMAQLIHNAFQTSLDLIRYGISNKKPSEKGDYAQILQPLNVSITAIQDLRSKNRSHESFDNLSTISESISALNWIVVQPAPGTFVRDMKESGEYYGIRVLREHKGNQLYANWVNAWYQTLSDLEAYVRKYHTTGFAWGAELNARPAGSVPVAPAMPPPPPPPAPLGSTGSTGFLPSSDKDFEDDRAALLRELNAGTDITKRLKKVNLASPPDMASKQPVQEGFVPVQKVVAKRFYPPKFVLDGRKWCVEHQKGNRDMTIAEAQMSESVAIYRCESSVLQVMNKINNITIDSCKKMSVVLSDIISSVEIIHCDSVEIQCNGRVPLINVDGSDGVQIYTNEESSAVEVVSSKSSAINICILNPDGDCHEMPVPEQIRTVIGPKKNKLLSAVIEKN